MQRQFDCTAPPSGAHLLLPTVGVGVADVETRAARARECGSDSTESEANTAAESEAHEGMICRKSGWGCVHPCVPWVALTGTRAENVVCCVYGCHTPSCVHKEEIGVNDGAEKMAGAVGGQPRVALRTPGTRRKPA